MSFSLLFLLPLSPRLSHCWLWARLFCSLFAFPKSLHHLPITQFKGWLLFCWRDSYLQTSGIRCVLLIPSVELPRIFDKQGHGICKSALGLAPFCSGCPLFSFFFLGARAWASSAISAEVGTRLVAVLRTVPGFPHLVFHTCPLLCCMHS